VVKVFNLLEKEIERCITLTNGCALGLLVEALKVIKSLFLKSSRTQTSFSYCRGKQKTFLKSYIEEFKRVANNLKERKPNEQSENKAQANCNLDSLSIKEFQVN